MPKDNLEKRIKEGVIISDSFPLSNMFVGRLIGKGNYFNIYETEVGEDKNNKIILNYIIKVPKEDPLLSPHLEALLQNEKRKYTKILHRFGSSFPAPHYYSSVEVWLNGKKYNALLLERIKGKKLSEFVKEYVNKKEFLPTEVVIKTAEAMLLLLKKLHSVNEVYGDSFIPNIMIEQEGDLYYNVRIVDLGGVKPKTIQHSSSSDVQHQWNELDDLQAFADALYYVATLTKPGKKNKSASLINKEVPTELSDLIDKIWEGKIRDIKTIERVIKDSKREDYRGSKVKRMSTNEKSINPDTFKYLLISLLTKEPEERNIYNYTTKALIKFLRLIKLLHDYEPNKRKRNSVIYALKETYNLSPYDVTSLEEWFLDHLEEEKVVITDTTNFKLKYIRIPQMTMDSLSCVLLEYFKKDNYLYTLVKILKDRFKSDIILNLNARDLAKRIIIKDAQSKINPYIEPERILNNQILLINGIINYYIQQLRNGDYSYDLEEILYLSNECKCKLFFKTSHTSENTVHLFLELLESSPFRNKKDYDYFVEWARYYEENSYLELKRILLYGDWIHIHPTILWSSYITKNYIKKKMIQLFNKLLIIPHHQQ